MKHDCYAVPSVDLQPGTVRLVMIAEAAPPSVDDYFYARGVPLFGRTTLEAFRDAGVKLSSIRDLLDLGVYLTTAVKCGKTAYAIRTETVQECSQLLERELAAFPAVEVIMLMGDVAIKALNSVAKRQGEDRVIPAGSTYKIRRGEYHYRGARVFPSYLQAGPSFFIEKSKRKMIAEDIAAALRLIR
ncbi:MAG: uracil-DNA glycosylase family protein [Candidatus Zixiibacteriota bacterium]